MLILFKDKKVNFTSRATKNSIYIKFKNIYYISVKIFFKIGYVEQELVSFS